MLPALFGGSGRVSVNVIRLDLMCLIRIISGSLLCYRAESSDRCRNYTINFALSHFINSHSYRDPRARKLILWRIEIATADPLDLAIVLPAGRAELNCNGSAAAISMRLAGYVSCVEAPSDLPAGLRADKKAKSILW